MRRPPALASFDDAPGGGYRFTLRYEPDPDRDAQGTVILAPPFAEEMNRCRRMTSLAARRLVGLGWRVLVRDLHGCGDSSGDFADASWQTWLDDLGTLVDEAPADQPLWLWGVRAGALLLPSMLQRRCDANVLLWQPALAGQTVLSQFLRLKTVAAALSGEERSDVNSLRASLFAGQPQEVAGYTINLELAAGLEGSPLTLTEAFRGRVVWLEVAGAEPPSLLPAGERLRGEWAARGLAVEAAAVAGSQFWQTQETTECIALLDATERLLLGRLHEPVKAVRRSVKDRNADELSSPDSVTGSRQA